MEHKQTTIPVKPYSLTELCLLYEVTGKTMRRWLHTHRTKIGERDGRYYTTRQVETIFNTIGPPGSFPD